MKHLRKLAAFSAAMALALALLVSCDSESDSEDRYNVIIDDSITNGTVEANVKNDILAGTLVILTATPDEGYNFVSYTVTDSAKKEVEVTDGTFKMPQSNVTVSAKFAKKVYTVTFITDGSEKTVNVEDGDTVTKPADPEKSGYEFAAWLNDETAFDFTTEIKENITLTASWNLSTYTITYAEVEGATNPNTATSYTILSDDISLQAASKDGFTFDGWKNAEGTAVTQIAKGSTGNITLTASWTGAGVISVEISPNSDISISKTESTDSFTLTAASGFTGYAWLIDGKAAPTASVSEDGKTLTISKADLSEGAVYQVTLSALNGGIPYGAQISVKKGSLQQ